jgi:FKBP-type peptidyl-prolyl cis-trans isomerase (trigger factor)
VKPEEAAQAIRDKAPAYGEAKAQRVYLEEFRKSQKKALLMRDAVRLAAAMGFEAARQTHKQPTECSEAMKVEIENDPWEIAYANFTNAVKGTGCGN